MPIPRTLSDNHPSHRWDTICIYSDEKRLPPRTEAEAETRTGVQFLMRYNNIKRDSEYIALKRDYPTLFRAYYLFSDVESERWIIESGLLANVSSETLSEFTSHPPEVIDMYGRLFFDVKPRLSARGYILNRVLIPSVKQGMSGRDYDYMYKTLAYCAGWEVFTEFIDHRKLTEKTSDFLLASFRDTLLKQAWVATKRLNVNNYNAVEVIDRLLSLKTLEKAADESQGEDFEGAATKILGDLINNCKLSIVPSASELEADEPRVSTTMYGAPALKYVPNQEVATNG